MKNLPNQKHFEELARGILDDDRSRGVSLLHLEQAMQNEPSLLGEYLDQVELDSLLAWEFGREDNPENSVATIANLPKPHVDKRPATWWLAAAAVVSLFFGFGFFTAKKQMLFSPDQTGLKSTVAVLIDSEDCVWSSSTNTQISFGTAFREGETISITSGIGRLAMEGNAGIAVEGPAEIQLVSGQEARVIYGRVSAYAPEEAIGFRLITPEVEIVDLGTRFAANVDRSGKTEIHVFEGEVSVRGRDKNDDAPGELIVGGQARLYSSGGAVRSEITVAPESFTDPPILEQLLGASKRNQLRPLSYQKKGGSKSHAGSSVIAIQDFSNNEGSRGEIPEGIGFAESPWMASSTYTRAIPRVLSHSGKTTVGGHFLIRGRELSEATVPTRLRRKLKNPLPAEFYFSIKARYRGLDSDDFFALWIDSHDREDSSHGFVPNVGIRKGQFYLRLHRDRSSESKISPGNGVGFFLVGHYSRNATNDIETISLWVNPPAQKSDADTPIPEPDSTRVETRRKNEAPVFQYIGLRMGQYTEVSDELLVEKILITSEWNTLFE